MTWHYRAEVKGIQNWIMSTSKLRDLKGGSMVVENLPDRAHELLRSLQVKAEIAQAAAGAIELAFDSRNDLERFVAEWPSAVALVAPGLQVTHAWSQDPNELAAQLRARRNLQTTAPFEAGPWVARSGRSGLPALEPESFWPSTHGLHTDAPLLSKALALKGASSRFSHYGSLKEEGEGLLAFVHIDGTGIGNVFAKATPVQRPAISKAMSDVAESSLAAAVERVKVDKSLPRLPLQVLVLGGDDLTFVCSAHVALDLTTAWLEEFEAQTAKIVSQVGLVRLRAGAGIAIAARRYPFRRANKLAEDLCKKAKKLAKTDKGEAIDSVLALQRVTTSEHDSSVDIGVWRLGRNPLADASTPIPTVDHLNALLKLAKDLPRGGIRTWLTAFEDSPKPNGESNAHRVPSQSANRMWERLEEVQGQLFHELKKTLVSMGADPRTGRGPQLTEEKGDYWTPLRDALTLATAARRKEL